MAQQQGRCLHSRIEIYISCGERHSPVHNIMVLTHAASNSLNDVFAMEVEHSTGNVQGCLHNGRVVHLQGGH